MRRGTAGGPPQSGSPNVLKGPLGVKRAYSHAPGSDSRCPRTGVGPDVMEALGHHFCSSVCHPDVELSLPTSHQHTCCEKRRLFPQPPSHRCHQAALLVPGRTPLLMALSFSNFLLGASALWPWAPGTESPSPIPCCPALHCPLIPFPHRVLYPRALSASPNPV